MAQPDKGVACGGWMRDPCTLAVLLVIAAYSLVFLKWMHSVVPLLPLEDGGGYLYQSFVTYGKLKENPAGIIDIFLHCEFNFKPPMLFFSAALGYFIFGESILSAYLVVLLWVILILLLVYQLGRQLGNPCIGLAAVLFTVGFSWFHYTVIGFLTEIPLMAFLLLSLHLTFMPDVLKDWKKTLLLGLSLSGGLLSRLEFIFFILPAGAYLVFAGMKDLKKEDVFRIGAVALTVVFLVVPWYAVNYQSAVSGLGDLAFASRKNILELMFRWDNLVYYPLGYFESSPPFSILAIVALVWAFLRGDRRLKTIGLTAAAILIVYFIAKVKVLRHIISVLPLFGLLVGSLFSKVKNPAASCGTSRGVLHSPDRRSPIIPATKSGVCLSERIKGRKARFAAFSILLCISANSTYSFFFVYRDNRLVSKPLYSDDRSLELVDLILKTRTGPAQMFPTTYLLGSYNPGTVMAVSTLRGSPILVQDHIAWISGAPRYDLSTYRYSWYIDIADYIIRSNSTECLLSMAPMEDCNAVIRGLEAAFEEQRSNFTKIGSIHSERDGEIEIYRRNSNELK